MKVARKQAVKVGTELRQLADVIAKEDVLRAEVSAGSTHWHVEHSLLVLSAIFKMVDKGEPPPEVVPRSMLSYLVLHSRFIPRGRADAPAHVLPENRDRTALEALYAEVLALYEQLQQRALSAGIVGNHPYFGGLTARQWLRFATVHTAHHLKIIRDIGATKRRATLLPDTQ